MWFVMIVLNIFLSILFPPQLLTVIVYHTFFYIASYALYIAYIRSILYLFAIQCKMKSFIDQFKSN